MQQVVSLSMSTAAYQQLGILAELCERNKRDEQCTYTGRKITRLDITVAPSTP